MKKTVARFVGSLIYVLFGLALILRPLIVEDLICYLLAGAAVLVGSIRIISYLMSDVEERIWEDINGLAVGLSLVILGIFILLKGYMFIMLFPLVLGFMVTYKGMEGIQDVVNMIKFGYPIPTVALGFSCCITLFGLIVMMDPFSTAEALFRMLGIGLFVSGIADIVMGLFFSTKTKKKSVTTSDSVEIVEAEIVE